MPLTAQLIRAGHQVVAVTRSGTRQRRLRELGAEPLTADVLDRERLLAAVDRLQVDAVIHQLTALKKPPTSHRRMRATNRLRVEGTANLLAAAERIGAQRFLTQSMIFGYGYGDWHGRVLTEQDLFAPPGNGRYEEHLAAMRSNEKQVLSHPHLDGIALRYGLFYGVGAGDELLVSQLRKRRIPVLHHAQPLSWIYIDDAAAATVAALERGVRGEAYNVADDHPVSWTDMLREIAHAIGAPPPRTVPAWLLGLMPYAQTMMRGGLTVSNTKARTELDWTPAVPTYREGARRIAEAHRDDTQDRWPASRQ